MSVWNERTIARLRKLWDAGEKAELISSVISQMVDQEVSRNAILGKAHRLGLPKHRLYRGGGWDARRHPQEIQA